MHLTSAKPLKKPFNAFFYDAYWLDFQRVNFITPYLLFIQGAPIGTSHKLNFARSHQTNKRWVKIPLLRFMWIYKIIVEN